MCCEVIEITKRQDCLIREERVYGWITYECLNCDILCYAEPIDKDIATILISPELLVIKQFKKTEFNVKLNC